MITNVLPPFLWFTAYITNYHYCCYLWLLVAGDQHKRLQRMAGPTATTTAMSVTQAPAMYSLSHIVNQ